MSEVSTERLRQILEYDPETGEWLWVIPPKHNKRLAGHLAGTRRFDGYRQIRIDGVAYYTSRLACLYMTGEWPAKEMDHINRDTPDDRWINLRQVDSSLNKWNQERHLSSPFNPLHQQVV